MSLKNPKTYGEWARHDIKYEHSKMKRSESESIADFAARLYYMQMEVYSAYAGRDLDEDFWSIPEEYRKQWIELAEEKCTKENQKKAKRNAQKAKSNTSSATVRRGSKGNLGTTTAHQ
jgi:hypothetical protein